MEMIHTYRHTFRNAEHVTVYICDNQTTFAHAILKWSKSPQNFPAYEGFQADYRAWWNCICADVFNRTGRIVPNPVPKTLFG